jgi:hypothetical protein
MTVPSDDDIKYAHEYETHLGNGRIQVYAGHPNYCQRTERHDGHTHHYRYRLSTGEVVLGRYWCDGWEQRPFPERPKESVNEPK